MEKQFLSNPLYSGVPLTPDNFLQIDVFTSKINWDLNVDGRAFNQDGSIRPFSNSFRISDSSVVNTFYIRLGYFFLINVVASTTTGTVPDGSTFVRISLVGAPQSGVYPFRKHLCQGYCSYYQSVGYGSGGNNDSGMDHKFIDEILVSNPNPGEPIEYTFLPWYHFQLQHILFTFTTSAAVQVRHVFLEINYGSSALHRIYSRSTQAESLAYTYHVFNCYDDQTFTAPGVVQFNLANLRIDYGGVLKLSAFNLEGSDAFTDISIVGINQVKPL